MATKYDVLKELQARQGELVELIQKGDWRNPALMSAHHLAWSDGELFKFADPYAKFESFDGDAFSATFTISTNRQDRSGDIVEPSGFQLVEYAKNPRVYFNHNRLGLPIGSSRTPEGELTVKVETGAIKLADETFDRAIGTVYFAKDVKEAEQVARLVEQGHLEAASIGAKPIEAKPLNIARASAFSSARPPIHFTKSDLREWSIVGIPDNADCIAMHLSRGTIGDKAISEELRRALEPFASPLAVWAPGVDLDQLKKKAAPEPKPAAAAPVKKQLSGATTAVELDPDMVQTIKLKAPGGYVDRQMGGGPEVATVTVPEGTQAVVITAAVDASKQAEDADIQDATNVPLGAGLMFPKDTPEEIEIRRDGETVAMIDVPEGVELSVTETAPDLTRSLAGAMLTFGRAMAESDKLSAEQKTALEKLERVLKSQPRRQIDKHDPKPNGNGHEPTSGDVFDYIGLAEALKAGDSRTPDEAPTLTAEQIGEVVNEIVGQRVGALEKALHEATGKVPD